MLDISHQPMNAVAPKISFVSLGCPKALVDSERIITSLRSEGYELSKSHAGADVVIAAKTDVAENPKLQPIVRDKVAEMLATESYHKKVNKRELETLMKKAGGEK